MVLSSNAKAVGSRTDPVTLDDSDEDDNGQKPTKRAKVWPNAETEDKEQPCSSSAIKFTGTRKFCLILMVEPDEIFSQFLRDCESNCSQDVHNWCFQRQGTLHFTLFSNKALTYEEAMAIQFDHESCSLPVMNLIGFANWPACVALETDTSIKDVIAGISPPIKHPRKLHLSLYRPRGPRDTYKIEQFDRVRQNVQKNFGTARGVMIVLKEQGADYYGQDGGFYRIL